MELGLIHSNHPAVSETPVVSAEMRTETRELIKAVKALNATELFGQNNELSFSVDRESHRPLIRIVDRETREVIRQIPQEHALRMAEDLRRNSEASRAF